MNAKELFGKIGYLLEEQNDYVSVKSGKYYAIYENQDKETRISFIREDGDIQINVFRKSYAGSSVALISLTPSEVEAIALQVKEIKKEIK
jgi:hypothetical protein